MNVQNISKTAFKITWMIYSQPLRINIYILFAVRKIFF